MLVDSRDGYTPTPALSLAILMHNEDRRRRAWPTGSWSPRRTTRRRTAASSTTRRTAARPGSQITSVIQDRANELLAGGLREVRRVPYAAARAAAGPWARSTSSASTWTQLPTVVDLDAIAGAGHPDRRRPARRGQRRLLGRDRRPVRPRPDRGQPGGGRHVPVHDPGLGRQDPDGLLVPVRDGLADRPGGRVRHRDRQRHRRRPARHRHAGRRAARPEPLPGRGHRLPVPAPGRTGRPAPRWARRWSAPRSSTGWPRRPAGS